MRRQAFSVARQLILMVGLLLGLTGNTVAEAPLKLGHVTPPSHIWHKVGRRIAENLESASDGRLKLSVQPLSRLGREAQIVNLIQLGAVQMGILTGAEVANRETSLRGWMLPYVIRDVRHATLAARTPSAREMLRRLEQHGLVGLGYVMAGMRHTLATYPVIQPSDLVGRKIRVFPNRVYNEWWRANGAAPTAMPLSEVAPSLATGLLDAVDIDLDALVGLKFYQQANYLSLTRHIAFPAVIVVSRRYWQSLSVADRSMLAQAVHEAESWGFQLAIDTEQANLARARAEGVQIQDIRLEAFERIGHDIRETYLRDDPLIASFREEADAL